MDLCIQILNTITNTPYLSTTVYQKPSNAYLYLPSCSYHNKATLKNNILQEFKRYKLQCSNNYDYIAFTQQYIQRMLKRGYYLQKLTRLETKIPNRLELLHNISQNNQNKRKLTNPLIFQTTKTPRQDRISLPQILKVPNDINDNPISQMIFNTRSQKCHVLISYKKTHSLRHFLTKSLYNYKL